MLSVQETVNDPSLMRTYINQRLAALLVEKTGYDWPEERILRIADEAAAIMTEGMPASYAFATAFETELIMYGDGSIDNPVGILNFRVGVQ